MKIGRFGWGAPAGAVMVAPCIAAAAACVACLTLPTAAGAVVTPEPYGTNDAGGFRNVLPAGENGLDTAVQLAEFEASRERGEAPKYPPHFDENRWTSASGVSVPPFPFQNRRTFQQVVELTRTLPR